MKSGFKYACLWISLLLCDAANAASDRFDISLSGDGFLDKGRPVSATPFDPSSLPQQQFMGSRHYSARAVAVELILNAVRLRHSDHLVYRRDLNKGYRITTHWRFRLSSDSALVRYEIRF